MTEQDADMVMIEIAKCERLYQAGFSAQHYAAMLRYHYENWEHAEERVFESQYLLLLTYGEELKLRQMQTYRYV